ncbi:MAG TPA: hypothetical protein VFU99_04065 [Gaiellaceae bacterium]|nr:hypothetical protein [Gaiellaceae bacterium]
MFRRRQPLVSPEELRGLILLLMNIDDNIEKIRKEIVEDDGEEER